MYQGTKKLFFNEYLSNKLTKKFEKTFRDLNYNRRHITGYCDNSQDLGALKQKELWGRITL